MIKIVAHRGASGQPGVENTLESFQKAIELGVDMVEYDVRKTKDNVLVVYHDKNFADQPVSWYTYEEMEKEAKNRGFHVPLFVEVLELCNGKVFMDIEIKETGFENRVVKLLHKYADYDYNDQYYTLVEDSDIVRTTSKLYFRLGPSTRERDICLLDKNEELIVIGKSINNNDPSDIWYLVRARGQIGFVSAKYTRSLRDEIQKLDPSITNVEVKRIGYLNSDDVPVCYAPNGYSFTYAEKYQSVQILQENNGWYLVNIDGTIGYVNKRNVTKVDNIVIVIDLSDQKTIVYVGKDIVAKERCTTGKKSSPTEKGFFTPYGITDHHTFPDGQHEAKILWMPYNGGQGIHDASWEAAADFGTVGQSGGCPRQMDWLARLIYDLCRGRLDETRVLVQK